MAGKLIKWKKIGGGTFRMRNGKIIKPNQEFVANEDEIPAGFRDVVQMLEEVVVSEDAPKSVSLPIANPKKTVEEQKPVKSITKYEIRPRGKSKFWFDVINISTEKVMNDKALRQQQAEVYLQQLA